MVVVTPHAELFHRPSPEIDFKLVRVERLTKHDIGIEEAILSFDLHADLSSCFSWNTKQIFMYIEAEFYSGGAGAGEPRSRGAEHNSIVIWDAIVKTREEAVLDLKRARNEYRLYDRDGISLKGNALNVTVAWNVMPKVGVLYFDKVTFPNVKLPNEYIVTTNPIN